MKKLIALTLMVACLACCSLGCKPKEPAKKPAEPASTTAPADAEKPADTKPAE